MSSLQYLDTFLSALCTWRVRSSRLEEFYKEGILKSSTKFTGKHLRRSLFCNKAASWKPTTSLHTESSTAIFFKNIYFVNVCEGVPLKSKIFTGVSFRKILAFYYKRNRQLFYYEGNSPYVPLKIPECVNRVISQNFSELLLLRMPQQTKTCSKSTTKECFRYVIRVSL